MGALRLRSKPGDSAKQTTEKQQPVIKSEGKQQQKSLPHSLGEAEEELFISHFSVAEFFLTWSTDSLLFK